MIKTASSSEIFDIYAKKMISKRAGASDRGAALLARLIGSFEAHAPQIEKAIAPATLSAVRATGGLAPKLESGLVALSEATEVKVVDRFTKLSKSAHITESADEIIRAAQKAGYAESDAVKFLENYADDFEKMGREYKALFASGSPTDAQIVAFVRNNQKAVAFFNEVERNPKLLATLSDDFVKAGEAAAKAGKKGISLVEGTKLISDAAAGGKGLGDKLQIGMSVLGLAGGGAAFLVNLGVFGAAGYAGKEAFSFIADKVSEASRESEEHFQKAKDSIKCIDAIDLKPGSPAVSQRELIKENIQLFARIELLARMTDMSEKEKVWKEGHDAAVALMGSGDGSLAGFVSLISEHPMDNLEGFFLGNKYTSTGVGGAVGAAAGAAAAYKMSHTLIGAAIGGTLGALAGYNWIGKWYDDEITCLLAAGDAIKYLDEKIAKMIGTPEERAAQSPEQVGQPGATRDGTGSTPAAPTGDVSFLAKVLSVGATQKLIGIPGIEFTNEKKLTESYIAASGGAENAATLLIQKNPNISSWIESIRKNDPSLLSAPIDSKFGNNKSARGLLESVYLTMQTTFKNAVRGKRKLGIFTPGTEELVSLIRAQLAKEGTTITTSAKNNLNKMKKTSNSINNHELIRKAAETRVSYFGDANLGLKEQLTKSYYSGLTDMYNEKPQRRSSDYKDLYGFQEETGEDLVLQSHPKSVTLADAMGKGGLVENGLEQKEKSTYVALNTPSGNFQSKYASTIGYLQKLAKAADAQGKKEVSKLIKQTIQNLK